MQTDKTFTGLFAAYEELFAGLKNEPIKYLEVGISEGGSLEWAKNYFTKAKGIYGIDINLPKIWPEKTILATIDQNNSDKLIAYGKQYGLFDIIIDDASHVRKETENTFKCLYPFLKVNGFYIIEDWGAGYYERWQHCKGMETLVTDLVWEYSGSVVKTKIGGCYAVIGKKP